MIEVYTDGATSNNGKTNAVGGWAYAVVENGKLLLHNSGAKAPTTNQRMELMAAIKGIEAANEISNKTEPIAIFSDSAYLINCHKERWYVKWERCGWVNSKKQPVSNKDLWLQLIPYFENNRFIFYKVKGHTGDKWNEFVDEAAVKARSTLCQ